MMTCDVPSPLETITSRQSTPRYFDDPMDISYSSPVKDQTLYPHEQVPNSGYLFDTGALVATHQQQVATPSQNEILPGYPVPAAIHRQPRPVLQNNNFYNATAPVMHHADPSYVYQSQQPEVDVFCNTNSYAFPIKEEQFPSFDITNLPQPSYSPLAPQNVYPIQPPWPFMSRADRVRILEAEMMVQAARLDAAMATGRTTPQDLDNYLRAIQLKQQTIPPLNYVNAIQQWNYPNLGFYGNIVPRFPVPPSHFRWPVPQRFPHRPVCPPCLGLARSKMRVRAWLNSIAMVELDPIPDDDLNGYELEGEEDVELSEAGVESEDEEEDKEDDDDDEEDGSEEDGSEEEDESGEDDSECESDDDNSDCSFKTRSGKDPVRSVPHPITERVLHAPRPYTAYAPDFIKEL